MLPIVQGWRDGVRREDLESEEKRAAKRFNEGLKLLASYLNNLGVAVLAGAVIVPAANAQAPSAPIHWLWIPAALVLHIAGQVVLHFLKPEE